MPVLFTARERCSRRECTLRPVAVCVPPATGDPAHAATDDWPDTPRNLRVLSNSKSDWRKSRWITVNISWEYPIGKLLDGIYIYNSVALSVCPCDCHGSLIVLTL